MTSGMAAFAGDAFFAPLFFAGGVLFFFAALDFLAPMQTLLFRPTMANSGKNKMTCDK
jgi:hypothetical protein